MSSLRAVISAATRSSKSFCVLSSPITRSGSVYAWRKSNLTHEANFSSTNSCLSSDKDIKAEQAASSNKDVEVASDIREISSVQNNQTESVRTESFEEIISASRRIFSPSFGRDCQYRLVLWQKKLREAEKEGKQVDLDKVLSDSFSDVVEFSLTPLALPEVRLSVLKILLTQESDNRYSKQVLQSTTEDVMQLPMGIVAEIVRLISLAPPTKLRVESRRALVSAVVSRRWYEVGAKHLVFFMFQMDELYDVKTISKQLRLKSKAKEQISAPESKRNGKSNSDSKTKALNPESIVEETVANAFNDNGKTKEETGSAEEQGRQGKEEEGTANTHASIASLNMESRAITLANELKVKDLARVVSLLSRWNSRNEPLLNACLHRLSLADLSLFSAVQLSNLLQAMASLSLHHSALLENSTHQLASKLSESAPSPPQVCTILQALSLLRWAGPGVIGDGKDGASSKNLVKCCLSYLCGQQDKLTTKEAASVLTSLANLSAIPSSDAEKALVSGLAALVLEGKSPWWSQIHCVWCMSVLRALDSGMLSKVLSPEFVGPVVQRIKESASPASVSVSANKLAQINMAARLDLKGYDGPVLSEEQLGLCTQMTRLTSDQRAAKTALANTLRKFVDLVTYVDLNPTINGASADALMCANHEGEVRPLVTKDTTETSGTKTEATLSLALLYIPFSGVNGPGEIPTGQYQMAARHLGMLGYTPVQIFYSDLKPSLSILEKVSSIKARIKKAVQDSNPASSSTSGGIESPTKTQCSSDSATHEEAPKPS